MGDIVLDLALVFQELQEVPHRQFLGSEFQLEVVGLDRGKGTLVGLHLALDDGFQREVKVDHSPNILQI